MITVAIAIVLIIILIMYMRRESFTSDPLPQIKVTVRDSRGTHDSIWTTQRDGDYPLPRAYAAGPISVKVPNGWYMTLKKARDDTGHQKSRHLTKGVYLAGDLGIWSVGIVEVAARRLV